MTDAAACSLPGGQQIVVADRAWTPESTADIRLLIRPEDVCVKHVVDHQRSELSRRYGDVYPRRRRDAGSDDRLRRLHADSRHHAARNARPHARHAGAGRIARARLQADRGAPASLSRLHSTRFIQRFTQFNRPHLTMTRHDLCVRFQRLRHLRGHARARRRRHLGLTAVSTVLGGLVGIAVQASASPGRAGPGRWSQPMSS